MNFIAQNKSMYSDASAHGACGFASLETTQDQTVGPVKWTHRYSYSILAHEVSLVTRYYDRVINWCPVSEGSRQIFSMLHASKKQTINIKGVKWSGSDPMSTSLVFLGGNINYTADIQGLLEVLKPSLFRADRLVAIIYNPYMRCLFKMMTALGLRKGPLPSNFITRSHLGNIAKIAGFEVTRLQPVIHFPFKLGFIGPLINCFLRTVPGLRWMGVAVVALLRPIVNEEDKQQPSLSILIPARNEKGNIVNAISKLSNLSHIPVEILFVEGHSSDGTWEEIQKVLRDYSGSFRIHAYRQEGIGKKDAVRLGLSKATGDVLTILDADLTMPPESLLRFYEAYVKGLGDLINGSRMVYPAEPSSMQFLNLLGNIFFAKALSFVLDTSITDSLCGTKLLSRCQYQNILRWCKDFGDFDPFGDFELLFPSASLGFGIVDIPVNYLARRYGSTNINRFQHGWQLLRMTVIVLFSLKIGRMRGRSQNLAPLVARGRN